MITAWTWDSDCALSRQVQVVFNIFLENCWDWRSSQIIRVLDCSEYFRNFCTCFIQKPGNIVISRNVILNFPTDYSPLFKSIKFHYIIFLLFIKCELPPKICNKNPKNRPISKHYFLLICSSWFLVVFGDFFLHHSNSYQMLDEFYNEFQFNMEIRIIRNYAERKTYFMQEFDEKIFIVVNIF